jgi:hypothetical protein
MKLASLFVVTLLAALPALAQNDISWVSRSGDNGNLCTITQPCRTFQVAYNHTNIYGIVKAMDAAEYGAIGIYKPITIDGNGVGATIEASLTTGWGVNVSNAGRVGIRNLTIHVAPGCVCDGIDTGGASYVGIEDVSIIGAPYAGVGVAGGIATIHGLAVTGANNGILVSDATATISDSVVGYSNVGIAGAAFTAATQVLIERSKMISNNIGLSVQNAGFAATARISDCVITGNTTGVSTLTGGQIVTFRNNTWAGNSTDGSTPFSISLK